MGRPVVCPVCQFENLEGEDSCSNCGSDLRSIDVPERAEEFQGRLLGEHLEAVGVDPPLVVDPSEPALTAIRRMRDSGRDCLLVMVGDRLVGIFTERDAVLRLAGRRIEAFDVRDAMTADPVVLRRDDTLAVAIHKMAVGGFRHIPILDGDRPVGVIGARDVFRHVLESLG